MATFANIDLQEPSTVTAEIAAIQLTRNSSAELQEIQSIGDPEVSTAIARVVNADAGSTAAGVVVRPVFNSTAAQNPVTIYSPSTQGDLVVELAPPASVEASSYLPVRLTDGSSFLTPGNEYTDGSTISSLAGPALTYSNSSNDTMRMVGVAQPFPVQLRTGSLTYESTTAQITSTHSTALYELVSSVASESQKVYAIHWYSTHANPSTILFYSSNGQVVWGGMLGSGSSGVTGAIPTVSPPAYLFKTEAGAALNVVIEDPSTAASTTIVRISVSYFSEA